MAKGKSLCIYGAKGGTGKTIITLNLAGVLANSNKKVLIVDLDLGNGAIAIALNRQVRKTLFNFCDDYTNNRYKDINDYINKYNEFIDFIASPKDPRQANKISIQYLEILLEKCLFLYDVILFDTSHVLNEINVWIFDKVDKVLLVTTNDPFDLKNLRNVISIFKDNDFEKYNVLLNDSIILNKSYFNLYDIKNIIHNNVDYIISSKFHRKDMDGIVLDGDIYTLKNPDFADYKIFKMVIDSIILKEEKVNE